MGFKKVLIVGRSGEMYTQGVVSAQSTALPPGLKSVYCSDRGCVMLDNLHSSLPIEYQLKYGTACGHVDFAHFVREATGDRVCGPYGGFSQEEFFGVLWTNPSPLVVDGLDSLLVRLNRF